MIELSQLTESGLFVIAGPCVIESSEMCMAIARHAKEVCDRLAIPYVFKASFDKANRSSVSGFRGPGLVEGLSILSLVKREVGVPILTDIHETAQVAEAASVADILQIPAFLARQTDLLVTAGRSRRIVNVKKGQFMSPQEMANAVEKIRSTGNRNILLTERGTFFGYNRLVNDLTAIPIMKSYGCPVVFDATHSTQQPAGLGGSSGGSPQHAPVLARAAVAAGADGLFIETHPSPTTAKSDAASMIPLAAVEPLLIQCKSLSELRRVWDP